MSSGPPTIRTQAAALPADAGEREAFGLDAIQNENRRLVAFGFEVLRAGGWEVAVGDHLDIEA